jgi:putative transposase
MSAPTFGTTRNAVDLREPALSHRLLDQEPTSVYLGRLARTTALHAYLGGTVRGLDAFPEGIGGVEDHVHLLISLSPNHRLSDFVRELKKQSSVWVHEEICDMQFGWQEGYAAFNVSPTAREDVRRYIENQIEHHRRTMFREELIDLLKRAGVEYDPRYLD